MRRKKRDEKGSGSIYARAGWWVLRYREIINESGELKTVQRAKKLAAVDADHPTKASVRHDERLQAEIDEILKPVQKQSISPARVMKLGQFVDTVYLPYVDTNRKPSTAKGYKQMWNDYLKAHCEDAWLKEVEPCNVQDWLQTIAKQNRLSKTTLAHVKHLLGGVFTFAVVNGYFKGINPVTPVEIPQFAPGKGITYAYSLAEITAMLKVLPEPAATVVAVAAFSGLRLGEIRGLTWESYKPTQDDNHLGELHILQSVWHKHTTLPKTDASKARVPVIEALAQRLATHRKTCINPFGGPIFANGKKKPLCLDYLWRTTMKEVLEKAKVKWHGWHGFRRGLATNLHELGIEDITIAAILRHSDVSVTRKAYIKNSGVDPRSLEAMRKFSGALAELPVQ